MFLRTLVAVRPGEIRRRLVSTLDGIDSITETVGPKDDFWQRVGVKPLDLVVLDETVLGSLGFEALGDLRALPDAPEVIVLLGSEAPERRAELRAGGAYAVLFSGLPDKLFREAFVALAQRRLEETRDRLRSVPDEDFRLSDYATNSPAMKDFLRTARRIASRDSTVLLLGETGVGKGLLARSLHNESPRAAGPFVSVNCGAVPEPLLEAQLFGHERGAYTGADRARRGYFELAQAGTLFLDEIAEVPRHLQVKLLGVLEERRVRPVGAEHSIPIDIRLIAATNRDLPLETKEGRFRSDLFYRLNVVTLTLPALRERHEDIAEIAQSYVEHFRVRMASDVKGLSAEALETLLRYPWPGNIRELANAIERAVIMAVGSEIEVKDLAVDLQEIAPALARGPSLRALEKADPAWLQSTWSDVRRQVLEATEIRYLSSLLADANGRVGETAKRAGMDPRSLHEKMRKYGLRKEDFRTD